MLKTALQIQISNNCTTNSVQTLPKNLLFIEQFEQKVKQTIKRFSMFKPDDKILVAVSGGKDSTAVLYTLKKFGYKFEAVTVDAHIGCYTEQNLKNIRKHCQNLGIILHEIPFRKVFGASLCFIKDTLSQKGFNLKSCTVCGVLRRYILNKKAREIGATKLVTGHNLDDESQAFFMNLMKNKLDLCARSGPVNGMSKHKNLVQRVKPLYLTREEDIVKYSKMMQFPVYYGKCPCSVEGFRNSIKDGLNNVEEKFPKAKENIINYFLNIRDKLQKNYALNKAPDECIHCGEPCSSEICRACKILVDFKIMAEAPEILA
ncbi:TIGR00269 family protein [Candidatus Woesearchaeota archaeon]|nr:TIGR00269 family protein [Candidatus Woesearchaeota archaeon]